ncbi:hypothetical protein SOASR030_13250 [Leminorella grimontii]|uniref:Uncharacterized protein n=1 Tax=Leminorella grimontii TaxID=82981 RepID=A0AAV5MZD7_9GAMM|nr:hypothetical protein GLGR_0362 [Leminorella grimontii ATCC 33999 = DSM 5078]GKX55213.1 hypothetical protein SOASR030_13250 [Leminorella grimontii]VFS56759.1 Uncharacterised protein [Leminorella grimontii]
MNFEKLNKLTFTTVNPDNNYVCWDSEYSPMAPVEQDYLALEVCFTVRHGVIELDGINSASI